MFRSITRLKLCCASAQTIGVFICLLLPLVTLTFASLCRYHHTQAMTPDVSFAAYQQLLQPMYLIVIVRAVGMGLTTTVMCLCIAYPITLMINQLPDRQQHFFLGAMILPMWSSTLVRTFSVLNLLKQHGLLTLMLRAVHLLGPHQNLLFTRTATLIGLVYVLLPLMLIPISANLRQIDSSLLQAAQDLGATAGQRFCKILLPLSLPGIRLGCIMVFLPAISLFFIPDILGGARVLLLGNLIQDAFSNGQWPLGAALCVMLLLPITFISSLPLWRQRTYQSADKQ
jgi:spermidine/putrescine transport system permease protein